MIVEPVWRGPGGVQGEMNVIVPWSTLRELKPGHYLRIARLAFDQSGGHSPPKPGDPYPVRYDESLIMGGKLIADTKMFRL